jgi:hypothetical protein
LSDGRSGDSALPMPSLSRIDEISRQKDSVGSPSHSNRHALRESQR